MWASLKMEEAGLAFIGGEETERTSHRVLSMR
jgi:hypothetical protein